MKKMEIFVKCNEEFSYESNGERILKIGSHLSQLLSNVNGLTF